MNPMPEAIPPGGRMADYGFGCKAVIQDTGDSTAWGKDPEVMRGDFLWGGGFLRSGG